MGHLQGRRLARARVLRHVRHHVRRPSRSAPHPDVGAVQGGLSAAKGLSAARPVQPLGAAAPGARGESGSALLEGRAVDRRRVRGSAGRHAAAARHRRDGRESSMATTKRTVEVELSTTGLDAQGRPQRVPLVVDEAGTPVAVDAPPAIEPGARRASTCSSTSGRSIRRRTACCAWCSSSTARRWCAASRTSAICTAASRRSASTASTIRSSRGPTARIISTRRATTSRSRSARSGCSASRSPSGARCCASSRASCRASSRTSSGSARPASTSARSRRSSGRSSSARTIYELLESVDRRAAHDDAHARRRHGRRHPRRLDREAHARSCSSVPEDASTRSIASSRATASGSAARSDSA